MAGSSPPPSPPSRDWRTRATGCCAAWSLPSPSPEVPMARVRVATYNVHRAIGSDGRTDPERILGVLREIDADVYALQEVEAHDDGADMLAWLGAELGFQAVPGTTLKRRDGHFGNGVLS